MNVYEIEFNEFFEADKYEYVLTATFEEAFEKAQKILARRRKQRNENTELMSLQFKYKITDLKP